MNRSFVGLKLSLTYFKRLLKQESLNVTVWCFKEMLCMLSPLEHMNV